MRVWPWRVIFLLLVAFNVRDAFVVIHAIASRHPDTGVFWAGVGLLCAAFLFVLWVLRRMTPWLRRS